MSEKGYRVRSRGRSSSPLRPPPPRPRDLSASRPQNYPSYTSRGKEEDGGGPGKSRRIEKGDDFDHGFRSHAPRAPEYVNKDRDKYDFRSHAPRAPEYVNNRDRDKYREDDRRPMSQFRIRRSRKFEERDEFERDNYTSRNMRMPNYEMSTGKSHKDGAQIGHLVKSCDEDSYQLDHVLDGPRNPDYLSVNDYGGPRDYIRVREGDYYLPYEDNNKPAFALGHGGVDHVMPTSNLSSADVSGHRPSMSSCYLNTDKHGCAHLGDEGHVEKIDGRLHDEEDHLYEKKRTFSLYGDGFMGLDNREREENYGFKNGNSFFSSPGYMKGDYSQPMEYISVSPPALMEGFPRYTPSRHRDLPSKLCQQSRGLTSQHIGFEDTGCHLDDIRRSSRLYRPPQEKQDNELFSEFGRSKTGSTSTRLNDVAEDYRDHHVSKSIVFNPAVDECLPMRDDGQWGPYSFSQVQSVPDDRLDASRSHHARKQELYMLGAGSSSLNYDVDGYREYGSAEQYDNHHHRYRHHSRMNGGEWSQGERSDISRSRGYDSYDPSFGRYCDAPRKNSGLVDVNLDEPFERKLRNKHGMDEMSYEEDVAIRIVADGNGARKLCNREFLGGEIGFSKDFKKPRSTRANYEESWRGRSNIADGRPVYSRFHQGKPGSGDIKKRLGPFPHKLHVSQRLVKKHEPSVMKRLAPPPPKKHIPVISGKCLSSRFPQSIQDSDGGPRVFEGDQLEDHILHAKLEPPEESEDFKQLVQSAFFKYLKQINEMPAKKKKYLDSGKAGSLKCVVCGSNSDEFPETESLARHALTSEKVGFRSQHLGLHRALCALMGWKTAEQPSSRWLCEVMSNAESSALKEDRIIWPPVVIIYNSTMNNKNPDERIIVSPEKLEMELRDMGFGTIVKVCNGKPANQSVILVKFNGTLSGLQEADKYHKRFVESKHGRAELIQFKSDGQVLPYVTSAYREEAFLYGHLGIAEDLDKLDFDTKKRCVLRSKNEILSIVNIPLATET